MIRKATDSKIDTSKLSGTLHEAEYIFKKVDCRNDRFRKLQEI